MKRRDEYVERMKQKLDQWNAELDDLERRLDRAEDTAQRRYRGQLRSLQAKRDEARAELERVRSASEDSWEQLKGGLERSWDEFKGVLRETRDAFAEGLREERAGRR